MGKIGIIVASAISNVKLAKKLKDLSREAGYEVELINLVDLNLPLYSSVEEEKNGFPPKIQELGDKILSFKSFIIVAPEYNGVMPPVLNNAIAWVSRSTKNWRDSFNEKSVALATHSGGGGHKVLQSMRIMFQHLGANVLSRELLTSYDKPLNEDSAKNIIKQLTKLS